MAARCWRKTGRRRRSRFSRKTGSRRGPIWNWRLGRAYAAAGQPAKAAEILRNLYITMPLSAEASQADVELKKLASTTQLPPLGLNGRRTRADLLAKGKRFSDAADEYRDLLSVVSPSDRPEIQLALAVALRRSGEDKEAKKVLDALESLRAPKSTRNAFSTWERSRAPATTKQASCATWVNCGRAAPTSFWLQQALLSAGNFYLLKPDYDKAIDAYRELQQRFPNAGRASYAHWKVAWLSLRQGRNAEAKAGFEQQIALYPTSAEIPAALYWRARLAEEDNDPAMARAYYQKLSERFRNFYYGELARRRLRENQAGRRSASTYALLDRVPGHRRRDQHHRQRSAHRQPALSESAGAGERRPGGLCGPRAAGRRHRRQGKLGDGRDRETLSGCGTL